MRPVARYSLVTLILVTCSLASGDRLVQAPTGRITLPGHVDGRYWWRLATGESLGLFSFGLPKEDLGLEVEVETYRFRAVRRETLGLHYSVISEAFTNNLAPGLAVGVRDVLNNGPEGRSWYLAATKTLRLTELGERLLGSVRLHAGFASSPLGGAYAGASVDMPFRTTLAAEVFNGRTNVSARIGIAGPLSANLVYLHGRAYAGLRVHISR